MKMDRIPPALPILVMLFGASVVFLVNDAWWSLKNARSDAVPKFRTVGEVCDEIQRSGEQGESRGWIDGHYWSIDISYYTDWPFSAEVSEEGQELGVDTETSREAVIMFLRRVEGPGILITIDPKAPASLLWKVIDESNEVKVPYMIRPQAPALDHTESPVLIQEMRRRTFNHSSVPPP